MTGVETLKTILTTNSKYINTDCNNNECKPLRKRESRVRFDENLNCIYEDRYVYDDDDNSENDVDTSAYDRRVEKKNKDNPRSFTNFCWLIASLIVFHYSDIINVLLNDQAIFRTLAFIGLCLIFINMLIGFYLIVWLSMIKHVDSDLWSQKYPLLIPFATGSFVFGSILLTIALWPAYGWLTLPTLFTLFMGILIIIINLPSWF